MKDARYCHTVQNWMYWISTAFTLGISDIWTELIADMFCLIFKPNFILGFIIPWFLHCATLKYPKHSFLSHLFLQWRKKAKEYKLYTFDLTLVFWGLLVCLLGFFLTMQLYSHFLPVFVPNPLICTNALVTRRCPQQKALFQMESCWSHAERDYNLPV